MKNAHRVYQALTHRKRPPLMRSISGVAILLCYLLFSGAAFGQTSVWTGGDGNWNNSGQWTGGVPTSVSVVFIDNNNPLASSVTLNTHAQVSEVITTSGDSLTIAGETLINHSSGSLTVDAALLNGNTSIGGGASLTINQGAINNGQLSLSTGIAKGIDGLLGGLIDGNGMLINNSQIVGTGTIAVNVDNTSGVFLADSSGRGITLDGVTVTGGVLSGTFTALNGATIKDATLGLSSMDTVRLTDGSTLGTQGTVTSVGVLFLGNNSTVGVQGTLINNFNMFLSNSTINGSGTLVNSGALSGSGTIAVNVSNGFMEGVDSGLTLNGATVTGGTLDGTFTALNGATIKDAQLGFKSVGMNLTDGSTLGLEGTVTNTAQLTLGSLGFGPGPGPTIIGSGTLVNNSFVGGAGVIAVNVINNGSIVSQVDGQSLVIRGNISGSGNVGVTGGGTLTLDNVTVQATNLTVNGGSALNGNGTIAAFLGNSGTITPGLGGTPGTLNVLGDFQNDGTLNILLGGTGAGEFSSLLVSGNIFLNGTLDADLLNSIPLQIGDSFIFLTYGGTRAGTFNSLDLPTLTGNMFWTLNYDDADHDVMLEVNGNTTATPEPGTGVLLLGAIATIFCASLLRKKLPTLRA